MSNSEPLPAAGAAGSVTPEASASGSESARPEPSAAAAEALALSANGARPAAAGDRYCFAGEESLAAGREGVVVAVEGLAAGDTRRDGGVEGLAADWEGLAAARGAAAAWPGQGDPHADLTPPWELPAEHFAAAAADEALARAAGTEAAAGESAFTSAWAAAPPADSSYGSAASQAASVDWDAASARGAMLPGNISFAAGAPSAEALCRLQQSSAPDAAQAAALPQNHGPVPAAAQLAAQSWADPGPGLGQGAGAAQAIGLPPRPRFFVFDTETTGALARRILRLRRIASLHGVSTTRSQPGVMHSTCSLQRCRGVLKRVHLSAKTRLQETGFATRYVFHTECTVEWECWKAKGLWPGCSTSAG